MARAKRYAILSLPSAALVWLAVFGLPPSLILSPADRVNYELLREADWFAGRAVGYGRVEPPEARAFVALAGARGGGTAFKYLLLRGGPAGRTYALIGLRHTNPMFFRVAVQPFRFLPGEVATFHGCILTSEPVRTVVESDEPNTVRLARGQTLKDWWKQRPRKGEVTCDIIGGGYTAVFLEWNDAGQAVSDYLVR